METGEGEMLAVEPNALHTISKVETETLPDSRQRLEHGSNRNGLISERLEQLRGAERTVTGLLPRAGKKKRSARVSSNLRKSLAWDKAFSTDEGVLDVDELPLVTKTPRKPLELHLLDIPEILGKFSPAPVLENQSPNAITVARGEMITSSPVQVLRHLGCLSSGSPNSRTLETTPSKGSSPVVALSSRDTNTSKLDSKSSASGSEIVKADTLKGTRLRLPSTFTGKRGKSDMPPKPVSVPQSNFLRRCKSSSSILSPSSASAALAKKVSSVSKKVKDTLGKVLPGSLGASVKHFKVKDDRVFHQGQAAKTTQTPAGHRHGSTEDDVNSSRPASVANSKSNKKKDAKVEENNQEPTEQLGNGNVIPGVTGSSKGKIAGISSKKSSDNPSCYSIRVSPGISGKKLRPEGSQSPPVEKANHANGAHSSKGPSSGLRLPSPKIGFFDTLRSASGEHPSTLPEKVLGSASDVSNSKNSRKGLPPRPKHGLPSGQAEKPSRDGSSHAKVSIKLVSSGIPSAPHLRRSGKSASLVRSASAATSPHRQHHGIRSSASHQVVTGRRLSPQATSDQFNNCVSELRTRTLWNAASEASQNLILDSRNCEPGQSLNLMGLPEVEALPQVLGKPSGLSATGYKQYAKFANLGGDKSPSKLPTAMSDETLCEEFDRVSSAQSASAPEFESCLGTPILDKSMGHPARENAFSPGEDYLGMANLGFGSSLGHDSRLNSDHEIDDASKFSEVDRSVNFGLSCSAQGQLILDDSPKATTSGNKELSRNSPKIEDSKMSSGQFATEERAQRLRTISPAKHPEKECTKISKDSCLDSPSAWSEWSLLAATNKLSFQPSLSQEQSPSTTPTFKRFSNTSTATAEDTRKNTPESVVRSSPPTAASHAQSSKYPLAVNAGLMNGISKRTSLPASRKERNLQIEIEQAAAESTSGQENKRGLDGQVGGPQLHKPKQRKSNFSHRLDQSEAYGDMFSEERLRALEAAGQESLQTKSGAVQHSPPNKTSPNRNPWSPVKKGGQQPGPFDCTKKYTNACMGQ